MRNHKLWKKENLSGLQLLDRIPRLAILGVLFGFLFLALISRLYRLQILEGAANQEEFMSSIMKTQRLAGSRGNIYDRNGNLLASNRLSYDITLEDSQNYRSNKERQRSLNGIAYQLIRLVQDENKLNTVLPISVDEQGNYGYTEEGWKLSRFKADFYGKSTVDELTEEQKSVTAEELMKKLCGKEKFLIEDAYTEEEQDQYGLPHTLTAKDILQIANIRYGLSLNSYRKYLPYLVASDVSEEAMVAVLEMKRSLPGADIQEGSIRVYDGGESLSSILGYTGPISADELEAGNREGTVYTNQSTIGKGGIEKSMEDRLRGQDGMEQFYTDVVGNRKSDPEITRVPQSGNDIYLTIDKDLQNAVYQMLEQQIAGILLANMSESKRADMPKAADASQIRISSDEVYFALIKNHVIDTGRLQEADATDLEKAVYERFTNKKEQVFREFSDSFDVSDSGYDSLSGEVKGYYDYLLDVVKKKKILSDKSGDWDRKEKSFRQYLSDCIANGWIDLGQVESSEKYMTLENSRRLTEEMILDSLKKDSGFDLLIFQTMLTEGTLTGEDVEKLLYDQGILSKEDPDYALLTNGQLNAWQFIRKKIKNLEITPAQLALNPCSGSAVVVSPKDGQVLACVSYPGYDNNRLANQMDTEYYQRLAADLSLPLFNRATSQLTAPGSTFKPVTVIAGLNEGAISTDTSIVCTGVFDKIEPPLRCWKRSGHGPILSSADALKNSCNVYLSEITYRLGTVEDGLFSEEKGLNKLREYAGLLDLDKKTGIEIGEAEPHVTDRFAIPSSIGQGTHNYTTTQIARYTSTLANHGNSYDLSLIYKVTDSDGNTIQSFTPVLQSNVSIPDYIWNDVAKGMNELAKTNATLKDLKVNAAGKTGTAEESKSRPNHGLFIGYAPFEDPQIAVTVRVANGYSSGNVVGVGKEIFNYYFHLEDPADILTGTASGVSNNLRTD
ncbi:penicillin-binding transpeptidase domain-containing protein [Lacrimispora sphenoides]|uniref:Penicillin-binding protein 2 n=1 Tax=Lacrimispora sphenoides JCM 1415 TaxID=1297793 RepID=A0ABY1CCN7_9FIRM|nr:penicillin-binding transpeptidase domain-containing protein [Lacrimispora sphenoides]SET92006.1 penicillin-binding protein 2 [[Clostridium] sphenoides JCM 1415]SUY52358.1 penicillin-binding protein transpeptidase [Lacrimispora sphenoides]